MCPASSTLDREIVYMVKAFYIWGIASRKNLAQK